MPDPRTVGVRLPTLQGVGTRKRREFPSVVTLKERLIKSLSFAVDEYYRNLTYEGLPNRRHGHPEVSSRIIVTS